MLFTSSRLRQAGSGVGVALLLAGGLTGCAGQSISLDYTPPTMAPLQSIDEACQLTGDEVNRLTIDAEQKIKQGIDQAASDIAAGKMPSLDFSFSTVDEALAEVQAEVDNPEVASALLDLRASLQGIGEIGAPESALAVPGYIATLTSQMQSLVSAGTELQNLCGITTETGAAGPDTTQPGTDAAAAE